MRPCLRELKISSSRSHACFLLLVEFQCVVIAIIFRSSFHVSSHTIRSEDVLEMMMYLDRKNFFIIHVTKFALKVTAANIERDNFMRDCYQIRTSCNIPFFSSSPS